MGSASNTGSFSAMYFVTMTDADLMRGYANLMRLLGPSGMANFMNLEVGPWLKQRAEGRFQAEGDDASGKWAPLHPATVAIRSTEQYPLVSGEGPINKRTGALENWVTQGGWIATPHALGATLRYPARKPTGETKSKAETAQHGRKIAPVTVPRPVLAVNETDLLFVMAALHADIQEAIE